jgi:hypothetical protein
MKKIICDLFYALLAISPMLFLVSLAFSPNVLDALKKIDGIYLFFGFTFLQLLFVFVWFCILRIEQRRNEKKKKSLQETNFLVGMFGGG